MIQKAVYAILAFLMSFLGLTNCSAGDTKETALKSESLLRNKSSDASTPSPFYLSMLSFLYGPSLNDPASGETPTTYMGNPDGITIQNQVGVGLLLTDNISIQPVFDFELVMTDPNANYKKDQYFSLTYDSYIKFNYSSIFEVETDAARYGLSADVRYFVPTSDFSRDNNSAGSARLTLTPGVQFAHSRISLGFVNFVRYYFQKQLYQTNNRNVALPELMIYTGPLINYQINDRFGVWLLGEASMTRDTLGHWNNKDASRSLVDLEPGLDIRVNKYFTLSPYLNWFVNRSISTTSVNLMASVTL